MSPTKPALPAGALIGFAYEYGVDIDTAYPGTPSWLTLRRITAVTPGVSPVTQDAATYDDFGAPNLDKTSESFSLSFGVQVNRLSTGLYAPEVEALKAYTEPDAVGDLAVAHIRWYDKPVAGTPNPGEAYEGLVTVAIERGNTGNDGIGMWNITLTGKGKRTKIANPFAGWGAAVPVLTAITPTGKSVGDQVRIDGTGFTGVTAVKFDAIVLDVDTYTVVSSTTIIATIPATSTGVEPVTVTNATGISAALNYTVV